MAEVNRRWNKYPEFLIPSQHPIYALLCNLENCYPTCMIWTVLRYCLFFAAISVPVATVAQFQPEALLPDDSLLVRGRLEFLVDSGRQWTLNDVQQRTGLFRVADSPRRLLGVGRPPQWLRLHMTNRAAQPMPVMASLDHPFLDAAQFYLLSDSGKPIVRSGPLDWTVLPLQRPIIHRNPLFTYTFAPGQSRWLYARIAGTSGPIVVTLRVQTTRQFDTHDRQERLFWGSTLGILCWLFIVSILLGILLKESLYNYYGLYVLLTMAYLMAAKGFWFEWFPARKYGFVSADHFSAQLTFVAIFTAFVFVRQYILAASWHRAYVRRVYFFAFVPVSVNFLIASLGRLLGILFSHYTSWLAPLMSGFSLISILAMYGLVVWQSQQERHQKQTNIWQSPAQLYLLSMVPLVVHITGNILHNYGIVPGYQVPRHEGLALGYLIEFMFLSVGLGHRYKRITEERQKLVQVSLQQQLQLQQEQNHALKSQLRLQQEKERIARDLHDHVGAQLSVIASSLDYVRMSGQPNGSGIHLEAIGNQARDAISSLRETIWAINRENLSLGEFAVQLQQYINRQRQLLPNGQVALKTNFTDVSQLLTSEQALNLFRIVQEAVGNALRHARADTIEVTLSTDKTNLLRLEITDDGVGFDQSAEYPGHYGLLNMQLRAERIGCAWTVRSETGRGTTLSLVMPRQSVLVGVQA
jgi:two-component system, sensor histidine kinase LadS